MRAFKILLITFLFFTVPLQINSAEKVELLKTDWSFKGPLGKFDRSSLQRGYQVYTEVCAACHSMKYLSYRNLMEKGGPEDRKSTRLNSSRTPSSRMPSSA